MIQELFLFMPCSEKTGKITKKASNPENIPQKER
jgi:hypothetical protein